MDISLDPLSPVPLYQQLRDQIVLGIARGDLRRGDALAPVRRLGGAFGVNPATIGKGYDLLRAEGLVATNAKSGTFVARDRTSGAPAPTYADIWRPRLRTVLAEARAQGLEAADIRRACEEILTEFDGLGGGGGGRSDSRGNSRGNDNDGGE